MYFEKQLKVLPSSNSKSFFFMDFSLFMCIPHILHTFAFLTGKDFCLHLYVFVYINFFYIGFCIFIFAIVTSIELKFLTFVVWIFYSIIYVIYGILIHIIDYTRAEFLNWNFDKQIVNFNLFLIWSFVSFVWVYFMKLFCQAITLSSIRV